MKTLKSPEVHLDQKLCLFFVNKTDYDIQMLFAGAKT
jgi:hypothetical protein